MSDRLLTISKAAKALGVNQDTMRRWDNEGRLKAVRTVGDHRRYRLSDIERLMGVPTVEANNQPQIAIYCRVSSHDQKQKGDLERQVGRVTTYCTSKGYRIVSVLEDVGSGMSDTRPKLLKLFELVNTKQVTRVVVEHKDRLSRFGLGVLIAYFKSYDVEVEWVDDVLGKSYEDELVGDILALMASFSARIYGRRSAQNRKKPVATT